MLAAITSEINENGRGTAHPQSDDGMQTPPE